MDNLKKYWYDVYSPAIYPRTYQTLESIVSSNVNKNGDSIYVEIYYDISKIKTFEYNDNRGITYEGHKNPASMPYIVEDAKNFTTGHDEPSYAMTRTIKWMKTKNEFENSIRQEFKRRGVDIQIK